MYSPKQQSQSSPQSEAFIQSALDALTAHIAILDEQSTILRVNSAWRQFADDNNYKDETYGVGLNYLEMCDRAASLKAKEAAVVAKGIRHIMKNPANEFHLEYPCHGNNVKRWFVMHVTHFDWEGQPRYIVAHQNVTELKLVQLALAESKKKTQAILDNVVNGIITLNQFGKIEFANPAALSIFDYKMAEITRLNLPELLAVPYRSKQPMLLLNTLNNEMGYEINGQRKSNEVFPIHLTLTAVKVGTTRSYILIVQDITDRKRMEMELLEKERLRIELGKERELRDMKNRFIATMSHELRTPLASIMLSADMLKRYSHQATDEEKMMYLRNIKTQVDLITELMQDVQTINHADGQTRIFMPEDIDIVTYIRNIVEEFQLTYSRTHQFKFKSTLGELRTMVDPRLMRRVFNNLLSNAIKYSPDGGSIWVRMCQKERHLQFEVTDRGIGIPEADLPHLFEPFHRASNVDQITGTGLGLAITQQAIELHNGKIQVESKEGKGTTIKMILPISSG